MKVEIFQRCRFEWHGNGNERGLYGVRVQVAWRGGFWRMGPRSFVWE